ncbi:MAG: DUF11 domain-containing protein [Anaerolineales bacterium]|nr:DUF11 domain-containing protein [Anaerolineales bacterium]
MKIEKFGILVLVTCLLAALIHPENVLANRYAEAAANKPAVVLAPGDEHWASTFKIEDATNGPIYAMAMDPGGNLYIGGDFTTAGGVSANNIAMWDGANWFALGNGTNLPVRALVLDGLGGLYVGGEFTIAGSGQASRIAYWDGALWSPLGSGVEGGQSVSVDTMIMIGVHLFIGGSFLKAGGITANSVARWDGVSWYPLGGGVTSGFFQSKVLALLWDGGGSLYVGGRFAQAGGSQASNIARWDGVNWYPLNTGVRYSIAPIYVQVNDLAFDNWGYLVAAGHFDDAGGVYSPHVARYDGTVWLPMGAGRDFPVESLERDAGGHLFAGGDYEVGRWNGLLWTDLGDGVDGTIYDMAFHPGGTLIVGGDFTLADGSVTNNMAAWNGAQWLRVDSYGNGMSGIVKALATYGGEVYAGGEFLAAGGIVANYIARWDGIQWRALGSGMNDHVYALAVDGAGRVYAGGKFTLAGGVPASFIAMWDGANWHPLGDGMNGYVYSLAVDSAGNLYAGGEFTVAGEANAQRIARWDGTEWRLMRFGSSTIVTSIVVDSFDTVIATGDFGNDSNVSWWTGLDWAPLGSGVGCGVLTLELDSFDNLYAGGACVARWNGSEWEQIGPIFHSVVKSLAVESIAIDSAGTIFAGGSFSLIGNTPISAIAYWDGWEWQPLGSGVNAWIHAMLFNSAPNLFVGGTFHKAGDKSSMYIARWHPWVAALSLTQTDGLSNVITGEGTTYTLTVINEGPNPVENALVEDIFPASYTNLSWTCAATAGSSCSSPGGSGNIQVFVNLAVGGKATFTISGTVSNDAACVLVNTASVSLPDSTRDPDLSNNLASDSNSVSNGFCMYLPFAVKE